MTPSARPRQAHGLLPALLLAFFLGEGLGEEPKAEARPAQPLLVEPDRKLEGHEADVYQVRFSPDGTRVATGSFDRTVRIWEIDGGKLLTTLTGHASKVLSLCFSPDGSSVATASEDKTIKLWDVPASGSTAYAGASPVEAMGISADGGWLFTGCEDGSAHLWSTGNRKEAAKLEGGGGPVRAAAFSADGRKAAAAGDDKAVRLYDLSPITAPPPAAGPGTEIVPQGAVWKLFRGRSDPPAEWIQTAFDDSKWEQGPSGFGYSSQETELATIGTRLDDMPSGYTSLFARIAVKLDDPKRVEKLVLRVLADDGFIAYLNGEEVGRANVPAGRLAASAVASGSVQEGAGFAEIDLGKYIEKLIAGNNVLAVQGHNHNATSSDFVLTPILLASLKETGEKPAPTIEAAKLEGAAAPVRALAFSGSGKRIAAGCDDGAVHVWEPGSDKAPVKLDHGSAVKAILFLEGDLLAVAGDGGAIKVWNAAEGKVERSLEGHAGAVVALAVSADRKTLLSGGDDKVVRLWNPAKGEETGRLEGHGDRVTGLGFSADPRWYASASADGRLRVWNDPEGKPEGRKEVASFANPGPVKAVAAGAGRRYFAASGKDVLEWRLPSTEAVLTLKGHGDMVHAVAYSPDGATIASGSRDKTIKLWRPGDGKELRTINAHEATIYTVAFDPEGTRLASAGFDKVIKIWDLKDGKELKKLEGHGDLVFVVRFSSDGKQLYSGSADRTIRRWSLDEGKETAVLQGHPGWVCGLEVPREGRLVSCDFGGTLIAWDPGSLKPVGRCKVPAVVYDVALSPDGRWLAVANMSPAVFLIQTTKLQP